MADFTEIKNTYVKKIELKNHSAFYMNDKWCSGFKEAKNEELFTPFVAKDDKTA